MLKIQHDSVLYKARLIVHLQGYCYFSAWDDTTNLQYSISEAIYFIIYKERLLLVYYK